MNSTNFRHTEMMSLTGWQCIAHSPSRTYQSAEEAYPGEYTRSLPNYPVLGGSLSAFFAHAFAFMIQVMK